MMTGQVLNIAGYKFVSLSNLVDLKKELLELCLKLKLKGTILLSTEGTNQFLAGTKEAIYDYQHALAKIFELKDIGFKESWSSYQPFNKMIVKIKKQIIPLNLPLAVASTQQVPNILPTVLKKWLDENKAFTLLDTRNRFEVEMGTFDRAIDLNLSEFSSFSEALAGVPEENKRKPTVIFCTGGIRCEKAGLAMLLAGYEEVYQLDGGILNYFEQCGNAHYHGDCFVFDQREALTSDLQSIKKDSDIG